MGKSLALALLLTVLLILFLPPSALAYDRDAAVTGAENHWSSTDQSAWPGYITNDCANYASACIKWGLGGNDHMDADGTSGGWYCYRYAQKQYPGYRFSRSTAWAYAQEMRVYFWAKNGITEVGPGYNWYGYYGMAVPTDDIAMVRGDVVSVNFDKHLNDRTDHVQFGVGIGQGELQPGGTGATYYGDLIDQHNPARHHAIWHMRDRLVKSTMTNYVFRVWHIADSFTN